MGMTLEADHLVTVVFLRQLAEEQLSDATLQVKYQVQGRFFLDIVV